MNNPKLSEQLFDYLKPVLFRDDIMNLNSLDLQSLSASRYPQWHISHHPQCGNTTAMPQDLLVLLQFQVLLETYDCTWNVRGNNFNKQYSLLETFKTVRKQESEVCCKHESLYYLLKACNSRIINPYTKWTCCMSCSRLNQQGRSKVRGVLGCLWHPHPPWVWKQCIKWLLWFFPEKGENVNDFKHSGKQPLSELKIS